MTISAYFQYIKYAYVGGRGGKVIYQNKKWNEPNKNVEFETISIAESKDQLISMVS